MANESGSLAWNKARFDWKKRIFRSQELSRGAKTFAAVLCDTYANRTTGQCWPSNQTLADDLNVQKRTIQRYVKQLVAWGWLEHVKIPRRRRGLQLTFPLGYERDSEGDNLGPTNMTKLSCKDDRTVAHYIKEPSKNQKRTFSTVVVGAEETQILENWLVWLDDKIGQRADRYLSAVKSGNKYNLPSRFPSTAPCDEERHRAYFEYRLGEQKRACG